MKKKLIFLIFLFLPSFFFGLTSVNLTTGFSVSESGYVKNYSKYRFSENMKFNLGLSNYNYFLFDEHLGIFESVNFIFKDKFCVNNYVGICANLKPNENLRFDFGTAFNFLLNYFEDSSNDSSQNLTETLGLSYGVGLNSQFVVKIFKGICANVGFNLNINPGCVNFTKDDNYYYYEFLKNYLDVRFLPYISVGYTFD